MSGETPGRVPRLGPALLLGIAAAAFFSVSFVLNRQMAQADGHWTWSAALRFLMMIPVLALVIAVRGQGARFLTMWKASPQGWIVWGMLGCGLFYAPLVAACAVAPAWLVAATWPVSIVIGILLAPLMYRDHRRSIPRSALFFSIVITAGVLLLQAGEISGGNRRDLLVGLGLVLVSAIAHPVGNRGSMLLLEKARLPSDPILRLSLLILGSLPLWLLLCAWGWLVAGPPSFNQGLSIAVVAATGLIATPLFYAACDRVSRDPNKLAAVEATQAGEILFTLIFEALLIGIHPPAPVAWVGLSLVVIGFVLHGRPRRAASS
jgi:drug/metabolite transporter (DMT)-like permease